MLYFLIISLALLGIANAEVIQLDNENFEHLTQISTGATTGDWLVKFYAPWCGHCRKLEPTYERVAQMLEGEVNVARVDVSANRDLGTRFEIKGFPTIKLLSKGQSYHFKGKRNAEDIAEFARGGYQIHEPEEVNPPMGWFGEILYVYRHAYKSAGKDLTAGNYLTVNVFLTFMPFIFVVLMAVLICAPVPTPSRPPSRKRTSKRNQSDLQDDAASRSGDFAPPTAESELDRKKGD